MTVTLPSGADAQERIGRETRGAARQRPLRGGPGPAHSKPMVERHVVTEPAAFRNSRRVGANSGE